MKFQVWAACIATLALVVPATARNIEVVKKGQEYTFCGYVNYRDEQAGELRLVTTADTEVRLDKTTGANLTNKVRSGAFVQVSGTGLDGSRLSVTTVTDLKGENINAYFPTKKGHLWNFKDFNTGELFNINIQGQQVIRGHNAWNFQRTRATAADYDLISVEPQGVFLHYRFIRGNKMDLDPAVKFCDLELTAGKTYSTEPRMVNPATGNTTIWTAKVEKFEEVTVPAGKFACVKVNLVVKDSKLGTKLADASIWYGKGVGCVQRTGQFFGVFLVEKCLSYNLAQ
jgi:hypothetical protein